MHHTKVKADIGVAKVIADLTQNGHIPCIPEKEAVLYIPNSANCPKVIRFNETANNQTKYIKWASNYRDIKRESSETIRHTPEMVKT